MTNKIFLRQVYQGVKIHQYLPPKVLTEYDIIITSFNTLRQDFNYVKADDGTCFYIFSYDNRIFIKKAALFLKMLYFQHYFQFLT